MKKSTLSSLEVQFIQKLTQANAKHPLDTPDVEK
jgi:hypothetical protein